MTAMVFGMTTELFIGLSILLVFLATAIPGGAASPGGLALIFVAMGLAGSCFVHDGYQTVAQEMMSYVMTGRSHW